MDVGGRLLRGAGELAYREAILLRGEPCISDIDAPSCVALMVEGQRNHRMPYARLRLGYLEHRGNPNVVSEEGRKLSSSDLQKELQVSGFAAVLVWVL